jgi:hypothetical protein
MKLVVDRTSDLSINLKSLSIRHFSMKKMRISYLGLCLRRVHHHPSLNDLPLDLKPGITLEMRRRW